MSPISPRPQFPPPPLPCFALQFSVQLRMEKLRRIVQEIAYARDHTSLPALHRSLIPFLSLSSSIYSFALSFRRFLYRHAIIAAHRLPVPVISVGNLTWGGNGKTPMVEFISLLLSDSEISPLILTRGYGGGDEVRMLKRHFIARPHIKTGVGPNRAAIAAAFFRKYGYVNTFPPPGGCFTEKIGAVVLDDGMQHWSVQRDLEVVMVNALMPWGNNRLLPLGPLREPLAAFARADIGVIHHADLVSEEALEEIELMVKGVNGRLPIFLTQMCPLHFFEVGNINSRIPLDVVKNAVVFCVSGIGSANAFVQAIKKMEAFYVGRLDFSDHHSFQPRDIEMTKAKVRDLENKFGFKPVVVTTEKMHQAFMGCNLLLTSYKHQLGVGYAFLSNEDFDRDPEILQHMRPYKVMALRSELQILSCRGQTKESFKKLLMEMLEVNPRGFSQH